MIIISTVRGSCTPCSSISASVVELLICSDRILTCRIKSIRSPAKVGTGCYRFKYQPGSTLEGVGDPPPPALRLGCHSLLNHGCVKTSRSVVACCSRLLGFVYVWWMDWTFSGNSNLSILYFSISYVTGITITQGWDVESVVLSFRLLVRFPTQLFLA